MIEIWMGNVMDYLKENINEEKAFNRLVRQYFRLSRSTILMENENMRNFLLKLREMKRIIDNGSIFVKNHTKGEKKGFLSRWYDHVEIMENPEVHLDFVKNHYSERTYYRHKKKLKELGLEL